MIDRAKLQHILEYAKQQRRIGLHCKVPPEDMVEIVEMAMLQGADGNSPVIPDGWLMVPVEPTEEMLAELCLVKGWTARALNARYQAMLAAAPKPEA